MCSSTACNIWEVCPQVWQQRETNRKKNRITHDVVDIILVDLPIDFCCVCPPDRYECAPEYRWIHAIIRKGLQKNRNQACSES